MDDLFTIIDGVYTGPETPGTAYLDFRRYEHTVVSLGSLRCVKGVLDLDDCHKLQDLGGLTTVGGWVDIRGCSNLVSLGDLKSATELVLSGGENGVSLCHVQERVTYYSSLLAHEALNALHMDEVQEVPLYKNILLQTLQGG